MYEHGKCRRNPDVSWRVIEGQAVLVHNREGEIQVLNEVGTYLWEHSGDALETLVGNITQEYQVPPDEARRDALEFFESLVASGALIPAEG